MRHNKKKIEPLDNTNTLHNKPLSCDWTTNGAVRQRQNNSNRIIRHKGNCRWTGIKKESYKKEISNWLAIDRYTFIGLKGESAKYHVRYFEISAGGCSSLEQHRHEHTVICLKGKGLIQMGKKKYPLKYLDIAYIAPNSPHQLKNPYEEPFGFLCIVNAKRDKPKLLQ